MTQLSRKLSGLQDENEKLQVAREEGELRVTVIAEEGSSAPSVILLSRQFTSALDRATNSADDYGNKFPSRDTSALDRATNSADDYGNKFPSRDTSALADSLAPPCSGEQKS